MALTDNVNIRLPSTAITAGMVHNIHRISIIGHLNGPGIQIKFAPKAIDSRGREGTCGPLPPIERSRIIAEKTNSNLNQVWAKPKKRQRGASSNTGTLLHVSAIYLSVQRSIEQNYFSLCISTDYSFIIFVLLMRVPVNRNHHPFQIHFNLPRCQSSRGGLSRLAYLP